VFEIAPGKYVQEFAIASGTAITLHQDQKLTKQQKQQLNYWILLQSILLELAEFRIIRRLIDKEYVVVSTASSQKFIFDVNFLRQLRKVILEQDILKKVPLVRFQLHENNMHNGLAAQEPEKAASKRKLERIAKEKWENVLHYMVGAVDELKDPSIVHLLRQSNLIQDISEEEIKMIEARKKSSSGKRGTSSSVEDDDLTSVRITNQGFQFLLQDTRTQIWQLFRQYLMTCEERGQDPPEVIEFLFRLSFMDAGQPIELSSLSHTEQNIVRNLAHFGIVYKKKKSNRLYPTQLASGLLTNAGLMGGDSKSGSDTITSGWSSSGMSGGALDGYIIVETNFRVYAYTTSPLQVQLLSLFVELETRLPNIISGTITRDSVRASLVNGITADQIISYLAMHAHPEMRKSPWFVPPNIVDQMRLWERERQRINGQDAELYDSFATFDGFSAAVKFAQQNDWLLYQDDDKLILIVKEEGSDNMKEFMRQNMV